MLRVQKVLLLFHAFTFCISLKAIPIRSVTCVALLRQVNKNFLSQRGRDSQMVTRQFQKLRVEEFNMNDVTAGHGQFFVSSNSKTLGLQKKGLARRIKGIEEFQKKTDAQSGTTYFMDTLALSGNDVDSFVRTWATESERLSAVASSKMNSGAVLKLHMLNAAFWLFGHDKIFDMFHKLPSGDPHSVVGAGLFTFFQFFTKADHYFARPLFWDYRTTGQLADIHDFLDQSKPGEWMMLSKNFNITKQLTLNMRKGSTSDMAAEELAFGQASRESLNPLQRLLLKGTRNADKVDLRQAWLGVDLLVRKSEDNVPEMFLIVRGSEDAKPVFGRNTSESREWQREGQLVSAPVPISN